MSLHGRIAVITGGASGIGLAISQRLARDGAPVAVFDVDSAAAQRLVKQLRMDGSPALAVKKEGPACAVWGPLDAALLRSVDELHADAFVTDTTWDALAAGLDQRQLMDLVFTVGAYDLLAMAFNTFGLELDPGLVGFGKPSSA